MKTKTSVRDPDRMYVVTDGYGLAITCYWRIDDKKWCIQCHVSFRDIEYNPHAIDVALDRAYRDFDRACPAPEPKPEPKRHEHNSIVAMLYAAFAVRQRRAREQTILRAHHGTRDEYVWSEVLKGHVRIGSHV